MPADVKAVSIRIDELDTNLVEHEEKLRTVLAAIRELIGRPVNPRRQAIGVSIKQEE